MHKINLIDSAKKIPKDSKTRKKQWKLRAFKFFVIFMIILSISFFSFSWQVFSSYKDNQNTKEENNKVGIVSNIGKSIKHLVTFGQLKSGNKKIKGEKEDRINILLLGVGGKGHDGPYLSDTIIVASLEPSTNKVSLLSIPRDLYVPIEGYGWKKINHASAYGNADSGDGGGALASKTISKILNIPIHYFVSVDFSGFQKLIDDVGGLNIYVENSFIDEKYPDNDYGYEPLEFREGWEKMDGERSLKYARSRHGNNGEGSDFARSKRQQKVLSAFKENVSDFRFWLNPKKIGQVMADLDNHIYTNLEMGEIISLASLTKENDLKSIKNIVLSDGPNGFLYPSIINGMYVLLPKGNDFTILKILAKNVFKPEEEQKQIMEKDSKILSIEIQNGTEISGLASRTAEKLKDDGFNISSITNAKEQNYENTIIYDITKKIKYQEKNISDLEERFNTKISSSTPSWIISQIINNAETSKSPDIVIILGEN